MAIGPITKRETIRTALAGLAVTLLATAGGCAEDEDPPGRAEGYVAGHTVEATEVELLDGRVVPCIVTDGSYSGGLDCDWEAAR